MPLQATSGAASYDAFGGGVPAVPQYIEDVFSTYLYTGTGASQTIINGIDLSTKGGLVWQKDRSQGTGYHHILQDTARGATYCLFSNLTNAQSQDSAGTGFVFNNNGFTIGSTNVKVNASGDNYVSWTFRKQPKFFDVVTYTGNGTNRTISHNLGATPGCIIVKRTDTTGGWVTYHRSTGNTGVLFLNTTAAFNADPSYWNNTSPTSTNFSVGTFTGVNANAGTYVAYLFAHDAGGFGLTGTDNVISCGSYTGNGSAPGTVVTLGYEPQWVMIKASSGVGPWIMLNNMMGLALTATNTLIANADYSETAQSTYFNLTATGFQLNTTDSDVNNSGSTYIYIAIRRGPMKVPTSGTSVFSPIARTGTGATATVSNGITTDLIISHARNAVYSTGVWDRLRGVAAYLETTGTASESTSSDSVTAMNNAAYVLGADSATDRINRSGDTYANWVFGRAPGFFDIVAYTGTGTNTTQTHNLGVVPELIIVKRRSAIASWAVYSATIGNTKYLQIQTNNSASTDTTYWNSTTPTSTVFSLGTSATPNQSSQAYIAYLFATLAGVSKVGSYTGTGTTKQVDCGFTAGARFVLIKRTDSTGDWYVWDSARGIVSGNDPYLLLNSTAAEVTSTDYIDTYSAGFELSSTAPSAINASGGSFIFLAIS